MERVRSGSNTLKVLSLWEKKQFSQPNTMTDDKRVKVLKNAFISKKNRYATHWREWKLGKQLA